MIFKIENGLNKITIGYNDLVTYVKIGKPVSMIWDDSGGSVAKYLAMVPLTPEERKHIHDQFQFELHQNYKGREADLFEMLKHYWDCWKMGNTTLALMMVQLRLLHKVADRLYSWQSRHILNNIDNKASSIAFFHKANF
ncbi:hypothetical protein [Desertivirga arenae]|uniref:hypothetical protein n=1 Tax=Desertivirga arenae TaxID=2810309 RepID=UPI001A97C38C|nr:hypothetical protein [Pedobacter sp. SYSU D00823]